MCEQREIATTRAPSDIAEIQGQPVQLTIGSANGSGSTIIYLSEAEAVRLRDEMIAHSGEPGPQTQECTCATHSEDRGGGHFELMLEPDQHCPEHGEQAQPEPVAATCSHTFDDLLAPAARLHWEYTERSRRAHKIRGCECMLCETIIKLCDRFGIARERHGHEF